ncbi:ankyrin repeat protein [Anaeramoeba ignava]|uniref:Ankyrin repeat protein n=1 Tax=Anaeramoeba ignava TaxID=1746090 RepID=A0A9Q0L767_ANAIG|nr:ankyrin repeat protein [Anaeramoeba ignava]
MEIYQVIEENDIEWLKEIEFIPQIEIEESEEQPILHFAIENNSSKEMIKLLISKGVNPKSVDKSKRNSLHYAIIKDSEIEVIKYLIKQILKFSPNEKNNYEAFDYSMNHLKSEKKLEVIEYLISQGFNTNSTKISSGETILHIACIKNQPLRLISLLVEKGANVNAKTKENKTPLHIACQNNSFPLIKFLLSKGADINPSIAWIQSPFQFACQNGSIDVIKYLINKGAYINGKTSEDQTALHFACQNNSVKVIDFLISLGLDIHEKTKDNQTILHYACKSNSLEVIQYLIEKGVDMNSKTKYGNETILHFACQNNTVEVIHYLLSKGADINAAINENQTVLHIACQNNTVEVIQYLISQGVDIHAKTAGNRTALHLVVQNKQCSNQVVKYLIDNGIDINAKNNQNETALHLACYNDNIEVIKLLIRNGADVNAQNYYQETPLSYSIKNGDINKIQLLLINHANINLKKDVITEKFVNVFIHVYSINDDLNNLLKSNDNFSDLTIQSNNSFKFKVHKLILLTRFDNNETILQKFINICSQKSKKYVEIALNFIYTGFPDFKEFIQQLNQNMRKNEIQRKSRKPIFDFFDYFSYDQKTKPQIEKITDIQKKEDKLKEFFKEIGIESNWIESKKGRKGILEDLHKLYQENQNKDFTIIISEEKEIKVHKLILILRSELFKGMFLNVQDSSNQVHDYSKKSNETIQQLIHFFYHDEFDKEKEIKKEEFKDLKDFYQLNQNSIIDLILEDLN